MNHRETLSYIKELKLKKNVRVYAPYKYFEGLTTKRDIQKRFNEIVKGSKSDVDSPKSYKPFSTDIGKKTKSSVYTKSFYKVTTNNEPKTLKQKSEMTGVPLDILQKVHDKGMAAWRTGHRVGATPEQWGYARVHSFLMLGCTVFSADFHLFEEALPKMTLTNRRKWLNLPVKCPQKTLEKEYYKKRRTYQKFLELKKHYI